MTQAEIVTTELREPELTPEQQKHVTRIQTTLVGHAQRILEPLSEKVKQTCEDMDRLGVPKYRISYFVCQCAEDMGVTENHLRRLVPFEYKDPNQVAAAMALHDGTHMHASTNGKTKTLQITSKEDIEVSADDSNIKTDVKYGKKEYQALKTEFDKVTAENIELKKKLENSLDIHALVYFAEGTESDEELGKKVRIAVKGDPRYKAYLKKEQSKAKRQSKSKNKSKTKNKTKNK